jgi:HEAT repeat protein
VDLSALRQITAAVGTQLMVQAAAAVPGWTLRRLRRSAEGTALMAVVADSVRSAFAEACPDSADAEWTDSVAREWASAFTEDVCAALIAGLGNPSAATRFQTAVFDALEDAGADIDELGRFFDMEEFVCVLPQRLYQNLLQIAVAPDSPLRAMVGALLAQREAASSPGLVVEASPRVFRKDMTALLTIIKANALAVGLPRYLPPEIDVLHFTTQVRVREGMRREPSAQSADDDAETEAESVAGGPAGRPVLDWLSFAGHANRIVVLADPGMGKSWLLRRETVLLAQAALDALQAGVGAEEIVIPIPLRCDELAETTAPTLADAAAEYLGQRYGVPDRSRLQLRRLVADGRIMLLLDALDELPDKPTRSRFDRLLSGWAADPRASFRVTSRIAGYTNIPAPPATFSVVELLPFTRTDVASVVSTWGLRADLTERVRTQIKDPSLATMARIPLLTALLCAAAESDAEELPAYQAGIYERVLRRFLAQENRWPQTAEAEATEIDQLIGLLAPIAFHFAAQPEGWTDRMKASQIMAVMRSVGPTFTELGRDPAAILRDLSVRAGVLTPAGGQHAGRNPPYLFLHRTFAEYLTAWHLASLPRGEWLRIVDEHLWFDPDWRPTLGLLGAAFVQQGRPAEAVVLIRHLLDQPRDPFNLALFRAMVVFHELPGQDQVPEDLVDDLCSRFIGLLDRAAERKAAAATLGYYIGRLPWRFIELLMARLDDDSTGVTARILANSRDARVTARLVDLLDAPQDQAGVYDALSAQDEDSFARALLERFDNPRLCYRAAVALRDYTTAAITDLMLDRARSPHPRVRYHAVVLLRNRDDPRVAELLRGLCSDPDPDVRLATISALAGHPWGLASTDPRVGDAAADAIQPLLDDPDPLVRFMALNAVVSADRRGLHEILNYAQHPEAEIRARAAVELRSYPESAVARTALLALIAAPEPTVRGAAATSLAAQAGDQVADVLFGLLDDEMCAAAAYRGLRDHDSPVVIQRILSSITPESDETRLIAAMSALSGMTSTTAADALVRYMSHENELVRYAAAGALDEHPGAAATAALLNALTDQSILVRQRAVQSLRGVSANPEVAAALREMLTDPSSQVRAAAIDAANLSEGPAHLLSDVLACLSDGSEEVTTAAVRALRNSAASATLAGLANLAEFPDEPTLTALYEAAWELTDNGYRGLAAAQRSLVFAGMSRLTGHVMSLVSPPAQEPAEEMSDSGYLDTDIVILLQGKNLYAEPVYSYVQLTGRSLRRMFTAMKIGMNFKPADFGAILNSGTGVPSLEIRQEMHDKYNMIDVPGGGSLSDGPTTFGTELSPDLVDPGTDDMT